ncbi:MAG: DNA-directed RNA polymerase subunit omega [Planctomycetota bacterium]|jgi:DNA-directed RNA polymerase subunit K/omega
MVGYDSDKLIEMAGGRYRFVSLVQRRMRELQRGLTPLVERRGTLLATAIEELRQGKIWLASGEEAEKLNEERVDELPEAPAAAETPAPTSPVPPPKAD